MLSQPVAGESEGEAEGVGSIDDLFAALGAINTARSKKSEFEKYAAL